jgi:hypothetical protein
MASVNAQIKRAARFFSFPLLEDNYEKCGLNQFVSRRASHYRLCAKSFR